MYFLLTFLNMITRYFADGMLYQSRAEHCFQWDAFIFDCKIFCTQVLMIAVMLKGQSTQKIKNSAINFLSPSCLVNVI